MCHIYIKSRGDELSDICINGQFTNASIFVGVVGIYVLCMYTLLFYGTHMVGVA